MTCDEAAQLLPWLLNDSLDAGERREVTAHVAACAACRRALAESRFALAAAGTHLPGEALAAVAFGEAAPGLDPAVVEEHLAACPQCAADLELARTSRALADEGVALFPRRPEAAPAPARTAGSWRAAAVAAGLAAVVTAGGWIASWQEVEELRAGAGAAAGIAAGGAPAPAPVGGEAAASDARVAELTAEVDRLRTAAKEREAAERAARQEAEDLLERLARAESGGAPAGGGGPQVNTVIADLLPPGMDVVRGTGEAGRVIQVPANAGGVTFVVTLPDSARFRDHAVELRNAAGEVLWSARGLVATDGTLTFHLERRQLPRASYTLDLYGLAGDRREKIETYAFTIG